MTWWSWMLAGASGYAIVARLVRREVELYRRARPGYVDLTRRRR